MVDPPSPNRGVGVLTKIKTTVGSPGSHGWISSTWSKISDEESLAGRTGFDPYQLGPLPKVAVF
jgi:hypothetical protein